MFDEQFAADAWLDLSRGEQQRVAAQLVTSVENATVLLASCCSGAAGSSDALAAPSDASAQSAAPSRELYARSAQNSHVAVRALHLRAHAAPQRVSFPSASSLLASSWSLDDSQRFSLSLQHTPQADSANQQQQQQQQQPGASSNSPGKSTNCQA